MKFIRHKMRIHDLTSYLFLNNLCKKGAVSDLLNNEMTLLTLHPKQVTCKFEYYEEKGVVRLVTSRPFKLFNNPTDLHVGCGKQCTGVWTASNLFS